MAAPQTARADSNILYLLWILLLLAPLLHKEKLEHHRMSLFHINGGYILEKKLSKRNRSYLKIYTAQEMKIATNDYSYSRSVLNRCNPEKFYRGILQNREVVVMKIPAPLPESKVGQFVDELIFLSQPHNNVVRVLGCCLETSLPLVVYERHGDGNCTLSDCMRSALILPPQFSAVKAAAEAAMGLAYLRSRFVHGNFCSGNILLDDSFDAKLFYAAGSGLRFVDGGSDPDKSDVNRLAVVLGEVVKCGRALENDEVVMKEVFAMAERCLEERPSVTQLQAKLTAWTQR